MKYRIILGENITSNIDLISFDSVFLQTSPINTIMFPEAFHHPRKLWDLVQQELQKLPQECKQVTIVTHSEALLARFCEEVADNKIASEDIEILVFLNKTVEPPLRCTISSQGYMQDPWPWSFFTRR